MHARTLLSQGKLSEAELLEMERQATQDWIRFQEEIGIDILVDGEQYRGDMATYFAELMDGFTISGLVRSYGNRYYRKPIAVGKVARRAPMTLDMWKYDPEPHRPAGEGHAHRPLHHDGLVVQRVLSQPRGVPHGPSEGCA